MSEETGFVSMFRQTVGIYLRGTHYIDLDRLQRELYTLLRETEEFSRLYDIRDKYVNAYEWLLGNLYRTYSIQLYDDYEIRLNVESKDGTGKTLFLSEAELEVRKHKQILYETLQKMCS